MTPVLGLDTLPTGAGWCGRTEGPGTDRGSSSRQGAEKAEADLAELWLRQADAGLLPSGASAGLGHGRWARQLCTPTVMETARARAAVPSARQAAAAASTKSCLRADRAAPRPAPCPAIRMSSATGNSRHSRCRARAPRRQAHPRDDGDEHRHRLGAADTFGADRRNRQPYRRAPRAARRLARRAVCCRRLCETA